MQLFLERGKRYPSTSVIYSVFNQSGETNEETLCVKLGDDQGIMQNIQAGCVSWLVNLLGYSWSSFLFCGQVSPIVQHLVVKNCLGGINSSEKYSACKTATPKSEFISCNQLNKLKIRL